MQLALGLDIPAARPLVPIEAAMVLLDRDEDEILRAIESGALNWSWDIASPGAERREIRVWRESLLAVMHRKPAPETLWPELSAQLLPQRAVRSTEIQRWWSCSQSHVAHLLDLGQLAAARLPQASSGPNAYTLITRESVSRFLSERRVT